MLLIANLSLASKKDSLRIVKDISISWESKFSAEEKSRVERILYSLGYHAQASLGKLPFPLKFYCRQKEMSQPLGGCVAKFGGPKRGVQVGFDMRYTDEQFIESWKIHHEISHLHLPWLEKKHEWFYEGFATYMSRQIMLDMGLFTKESLDKLNRKRIDEIRDSFDRDGTFLEVVTYHQDQWNFSEYYWGGSTYFYRANRALEKKYDTNLKEIISKYQQRGRQTDKTLNDVLRSWDNILGKKLFTSLMHKYKTESARQVMADV